MAAFGFSVGDGVVVIVVWGIFLTGAGARIVVGHDGESGFDTGRKSYY